MKAQDWREYVTADDWVPARTVADTFLMPVNDVLTFARRNGGVRENVQYKDFGRCAMIQKNDAEEIDRIKKEEWRDQK
jgi:hypothetical protein